MATNNAINESQVGLQVNNGSGQLLGRTITGSSTITVINGSGTAGNPGISLANLSGPSQVLGSSSTSTTPIDLTMGPSMSIVGTTLNSAVSFFSGTNPNTTTPTDRPSTTNVAYIGTDGSLWLWNGSTYIQPLATPAPFISSTVARGILVTLDTISVQWSPTAGDLQMQCSTAGGVCSTISSRNNGSNSASNNSGSNFYGQNVYTTVSAVPGMTGLNMGNTYPTYVYMAVCDIATGKEYEVGTIGTSTVTSTTNVSITIRKISIP